ncbi:PE-PPE domain-containing protein [Mycobacterium sp.]|uniref:PE-PPE domain-containing protein n=1 Tax=Mycobacterium sp. TaxID=1785 RepID=UPI0031D939BD
MSKVAVSTLLAAPALLAGALLLVSHDSVAHLDYRLVDEALVIIPVDNPAFADAAADLYLKTAGFEVTPDYGNVQTLNIPEVVSGGGLNTAVNYGVNDLVDKIESEYTAGDFSETNPLYVFGYSQSSVVMGMAEQQLADYGIKPQDLNFVMVGDSASAEGGFLNTFLDEFPTSWQPYIVDLFKDFGADEVLGQVTPTGLFPTEVYSLSGDGWAIYHDGLNNAGLFSDHLEYLGLTPQEIATAGQPVIDGAGPYATEYFTIQDSMVNSLEALLTQLQIADSVLF